VSESLPDALKRVSRTATQPPAQGLLSYTELMRRLDRLRTNPRAEVEIIGTSRTGRPIPLVSITDESANDQRARARLKATQIASPTIAYSNLEATGGGDLSVALDGSFRVPLLFLSSNFGMEAAQVEALLELIEFLATDDSDETSRALSKLIVLIVPMINPDGRVIALEHWASRPLSPAWPAQGNVFGIEVTREYLHLVEPETRALAKLVETWHPFMLWEVHEDGIGLGWGQPQVCLCPPIAPHDRIGIDSPIAPGVTNPRLYAEQQRYGKAIADAWRRRGYDLLYDPDGAHGWPKYPVPGFEDLAPVPETRFTQSMLLRGVTAFITESCRVPGSQTWEDRIGQKVSAGKAILAAASASSSSLVELVSDVQRQSSKSSGVSDFVLLPLDQDPFIVGKSIDILLGHDVQLYRSRQEMEVPAVVVPLSQPLRPTIELLLSVVVGRHQALGASLGLRVVPASALPEAVRGAWASTPLDRVDGPSWTAHEPPVDFTKSAYYAVGNSPDGVTFANRLLRVPGTEVRWSAGGLPLDGFLFRVPEAVETVRTAARGLRLRANRVTSREYGAAHPIRTPRIGLYDGQGILENRFSGTLMRWLLDEGEFSTRLLGSADLNAGTLTTLDVLIVPNGNVDTIARGQGLGTVWDRYPWEPDEDRQTLTEGSFDAIRSWVHDGGTYIGVDAGGGLLATQDHLGLVDATGRPGNLGTGLVELRIQDPRHPMFDGIAGSWDDDGTWREDVIYAMYQSNPRAGLFGGCLFEPGPAAKVLASIERTLPVKDVEHIRDISAFNAAGPAPGILTGAYGTGTVFVFAIEPTYRATFRRTGTLVTNAIYAGSAND
jgi:hypothetical protein